ncbi:hypothetical protein J2X85_004233 [Microbacterium trichothecenolyticum]|uniref:hypothetical protein n=1 Tax=Microbacterium trichothecenolyticum TaxID=69370 RepID=UPI002865A6D3|nr:hypothetical protein [Microbacterium trichothecenolyticum]MDR7187163.1 hypothetical protein [Microbacterium trichothecenolyticum]
MDSDAMGLFDLEDSPDPPSPQVLLMTDQQRVEIRSLFGQIGVGDAAKQFEITEELTGKRIRSVGELDSATAHRLISGLRRRIADSGKTRTGNSWDDREGDTWIDRL